MYVIYILCVMCVCYMCYIYIYVICVKDGTYVIHIMCAIDVIDVTYNTSIYTIEL